MKTAVYCIIVDVSSDWEEGNIESFSFNVEAHDHIEAKERGEELVAEGRFDNEIGDLEYYIWSVDPSDRQDHIEVNEDNCILLTDK